MRQCHPADWGSGTTSGAGQRSRGEPGWCRRALDLPAAGSPVTPMGAPKFGQASVRAIAADNVENLPAMWRTIELLAWQAVRTACVRSGYDLVTASDAV